MPLGQFQWFGKIPLKISAVMLMKMLMIVNLHLCPFSIIELEKMLALSHEIRNPSKWLLKNVLEIVFFIKYSFIFLKWCLLTV